MFVVGTLTVALSAAMDGTMRTTLLLLILLAVALIIAGGVIATVTFMKQRKAMHGARSQITGVENERS